MKPKKLYISNKKIDTLQIKKVTDNNIFFDYDNRKYLLHDSMLDYDWVDSLKEINEKGQLI